MGCARNSVGKELFLCQGRTAPPHDQYTRHPQGETGGPATLCARSGLIRASAVHKKFKNILRAHEHTDATPGCPAFSSTTAALRYRADAGPHLLLQQENLLQHGVSLRALLICSVPSWQKSGIPAAESRWLRLCRPSQPCHPCGSCPTRLLHLAWRQSPTHQTPVPC